MSETKHSPEPWRADVDDPSDILDASGAACASGWSFDEPGGWFRQEPAEANARRIVACVNACAGIPTEEVEAGVLALTVEALVALRTGNGPARGMGEVMARDALRRLGERDEQGRR
jgi:hypothetical protein